MGLTGCGVRWPTRELMSKLGQLTQLSQGPPYPTACQYHNTPSWPTETGLLDVTDPIGVSHANWFKTLMPTLYTHQWDSRTMGSKLGLSHQNRDSLPGHIFCSPPAIKLSLKRNTTFLHGLFPGLRVRVITFIYNYYIF